MVAARRAQQTWCSTSEITISDRSGGIFEESNKNGRICEKYELIPSIIKDSRLNLDTIKKCYKDYYNFKDKLYEFDNKRIYRSALSDRLNI